MLSLYEAHPAPGSSGASLGGCELTSAQLAVLRSGGDVGTIEFESYLCTIEGPWVGDNGGGVGGMGVGMGLGAMSAGKKQLQPSAGMKKLLSKKFVKPARVVPQQQRYQQQQQQQQRRWPGGNMTNYHGGGPGGGPPPQQYGPGGGQQQHGQGQQYGRGGPPPPMHHQQQQHRQPQGQNGGGGNGGPDMRTRPTSMNNNGRGPLPTRHQHQQQPPHRVGGPSQQPPPQQQPPPAGIHHSLPTQQQQQFKDQAPPPPSHPPSGPMDDNQAPKPWHEGPPQTQTHPRPPQSVQNNVGATRGADTVGMGPASWQEGFGTAQQNPTAAAAPPSSSFAGNDFEANQFYGEEVDEEQMGVGALSALLGGATGRGARSEQGIGQNLQSQQSQQPPSQTGPASRAPPPTAPVDNGSDSLSRSDLMRMICGDSFGGEEDIAAGIANNGNDGNKRRKVEAPPDPSAKTPSAPLPGNGHGHGTSNGGDKGAEKSNGLFSVSLPSDESDSDDSD